MCIQLGNVCLFILFFRSKNCYVRNVWSHSYFKLRIYQVWISAEQLNLSDDNLSYTPDPHMQSDCHRQVQVCGQQCHTDQIIDIFLPQWWHDWYLNMKKNLVCIVNTGMLVLILMGNGVCSYIRPVHSLTIHCLRWEGCWAMGQNAS